MHLGQQSKVTFALKQADKQFLSILMELRNQRKFKK